MNTNLSEILFYMLTGPLDLLAMSALRVEAVQESWDKIVFIYSAVTTCEMELQ